MTKLFVGNFSFEQHRLPSINLNRAVVRFEAELACLWLSCAERGDEILCPEPIPGEYWQAMEQIGCPRIVPLHPAELSKSRATEVVPWGWTTAIREMAKRLKIQSQCPDQDVVWRVNSRDFAFDICAEEGWLLPGEAIAHSLTTAMRTIERSPGGWVVKPVHGQAGRGQLRGVGSPSDKELATLRRLLQRQGALHIEPLLDRVLEIGSQWDLPESGSPRLVGLTELFTNAQGGYCGSRVSKSLTLPLDLAEDAASWLTAAHFAVAEHLQRSGYFGPLGIDAMVFRDENRTLIRPVQDINARWTMGRIAVNWSRRLASPIRPISEESTQELTSSTAVLALDGVWWHGEFSPVLNALPLSPAFISGTPVRHRTWWGAENPPAEH